VSTAESMPENTHFETSKRFPFHKFFLVAGYILVTEIHYGHAT